MTIVTPIDGQPAIAEHVAQLTETLTGVRAEPLTLTGELRFVPSSDGSLAATVRPATSTYPKFSFMANGMLQWGAGTDGSYETYLYRQAANVIRLEGHFQPDSPNWWELGSTTRRWKKLWATDADLFGSLNVAGTSTFGADMTVTGNILAQGGQGALLVRDRTGGPPGWGWYATDGTMRLLDLAVGDRFTVDAAGAATFWGHVGPNATNTLDLGATATRWRKLWATDADFTNAPTVGGTALPLASHTHTYLPLSGGTVSGVLNANNAFNAYGTITSNALLVTISAGVGSIVHAVRVSGDTVGRLTIQANGTLNWGPGVAASTDTILQRTGAGALRLDNHLGVGVAPQTGWSGRRAIQVGLAGALYGDTVSALTEVGSNTYFDGSAHRAIVADAGVRLIAFGGGFRVDTAPSVALGAAQTFTTRLTLDQAGNLGVGVAPAAWAAGWSALQVGQAGSVYSDASGAQLLVAANSRVGAGGDTAIAAAAASRAHFINGELRISTAPSVAAGAAQTFTTRAQIAQTGTLTLSPDSGTMALYTQSQQAGTPSPVPNIMISRVTPSAHGQWIDFQNGASLGDYLIGRRANSDNLLFTFWNGVSMTDRASFAPNGTLTLTPDAGLPALAAQGSSRPHALFKDPIASSPARYGQAFSGTAAYMTQNAWYDGTNWNLDDTTRPGMAWLIYNEAASFAARLAIYGAGANPATSREKTPISVSHTGILTLTPDAGQQAIITTTSSPLAITLQSGGGIQWNESTNNYYTRLQSDQASILSFSGTQAGAAFAPTVAFHGAASCGLSARAWSAVFSQTGTIQPCLAQVKEAFAPLDPVACVEAVLGTDWLNFRYKPPSYIAPEAGPDTAYDASDSNEVKAEKKVLRDEAEAGARASYAEMLVETQPTRDQKGYVLQSIDYKTHDLFGLSDRQSASPSSDLAVVACALQSVIRRLEALEGAAA